MKRLFAVFLVAAGLPVASATAASSLLRPSAAQVRPRAFASCDSLVSYASSHFAVTHGVPEPAVVPLGVTAATAAKSATGAVPGAAAASAVR